MNTYRYFFSTGCFLGIASLFVLFTSCQPKESVSPVEIVQTPVGVANGMLTFKDVSAYEAHLVQLKALPKGISETTHLSAIEKALHFDSRRSLVKKTTVAGARTLESDGILDEHLASILNADNMVTIGDWIFKLDLPEGKCYVLPLKEATVSLLNSLKATNIKSSLIQVYRTDEDVLDLLAAGKPSAYKAGRTQVTSGVFGVEDKETFYPFPEERDVLFDCKVVYQKAAFYFSLQANAQYRYNAGSTLPFLEERFKVPVEINYCYEYIAKGSCVAVGAGKDCNSRQGGNTGEISLRPYECSRGLSSYCYYATYSIPTIGYTTPRQLNVPDANCQVYF